MMQNIQTEGRRNSVWRLFAAFLFSSAISAVITSVAAVYLLGWYDSKFRDATASALQVELLGMAISIFVASIVFILIVAIRARGGNILGDAARLTVICGFGYPIGLLLVGRILAYSDPESIMNMIVGLGYMLLYPAVVASALKKQ